MKVLIVGGTGLISTGITRQLVARGDEVTIYTRARRKIELPAKVKRLVGDRDNAAAFEGQMGQAEHFDVVIDMICFSPQHAESAIRAFAGRTAQYIFCSTVDVYTKPAKRYPVRENAEREPSPSFSYAFNKAVCERLFEEAHARGDFALTMIRPAWTYGEGGRLLHTFGWGTYYLDRLRRGKPVIVHGDGTSFWAACHRDDVARGFVGAAGNEIAFGRAYHLTGEELLTWNTYTQTVAQALGAPTPRMVHIPTDLLGKVLPKHAEWCVVNFSYNNVFDNTAARSELGFAYTIPFAEGARRTIAWLEAEGGFEDSDDYPFYDQVIDAWERLGEGMAAQLRTID